ncbi:MAG: DUF2066 domain-containing protein [Proteobacteria bacterium]|nr:DUF2066 domain-containing protein [Pseudomonadota bacterium]
MRKQKTQRLLASILLFCLCLCANAQTVVTHLYEVSLESQSQSQEEWRQLVQQGLAIVLERISTSVSLKENPEAMRALKNAPDYVEQYSYDGNNLQVKYSPDLVNQLIQKMGHMVWGQRRPTVVLWLAIEDNHQRRLIGQETDPALQTYLHQLAKLKGIPLILPLMDLEDMSAITVTDVWGQFPTVLQQASLRYGAQTILLGRVMHNAENWEAQWQVLTNDSPAWKVQGASLEAVLSEGFAGIIPYLKNQNQATGHATEVKGKPFLIGIEGVQSAADFNNVENYLKSLNPVIDVNIHQLFGAVAIFEITPRGDNGRQALEQVLGMDQRFMPSFQDVTGVEFTYRWIVARAPLWEENQED